MFDIIIDTFINYLIFNFLYYLTSGILFLSDYFGWFTDQKIQNKKQNYYLKCYEVVMWNTLIHSWLPCFFLACYTNYYPQEYSFLKMVFDLFFSLIVTDFVYYLVHRILHTKYFYQYHKQHHQIVAPIGFSAVYMSWFDFCFGNIIPVFLPLFILGSDVITIRLWIAIITINTVMFAHSGYQIADFHDKHHEKINKNFGINLYMDKIFGTEYR